MSRSRAFLLRSAALSAFGLCLAGQFAPADITSAVSIGIIAGALSVAHSSAAGRPLRARAPWFQLASGMALQLAREAAQVAGTLMSALVRDRRGSIAQMPVAVRPARSAGTRALATLMASIAPNGIALETPPARAHTLKVHRLTRSESQTSRRGRPARVGPSP